MVRGAGRKNAKPGAFGTVHKLPSGRYRAMYTGPDGRRHKAPTTFTVKQDARGWLSLVQADIIRKAWSPPEAEPKAVVHFTDYAAAWLENRTVKGRPIKARTRDQYEDILVNRLLPTFGDLPIGSITSEDVAKWHAAQVKLNTPTLTANAYSLLSTIMKSAMADSKHLVTINPCVIPGAGQASRNKRIKPATVDELGVIVGEMPGRFKLLIWLAAWCALRFSEATALTRADVHLERGKNGVTVAGYVDVQRGAVRSRGDGRHQTSTKSEAGTRTVEIPPHLLPVVESHLKDHVGEASDALLFPAAHGGLLSPNSLYRHYYPARAAAGRDDLRFHDLRHTGAVLAASTGATLVELMRRLGHSTPTAALRYQHVVDGRDRAIAAMLSDLVSDK
ncbi:tyrosine-type recombinase/integrase [Gordonia sp. KTR9]|uniref:tyrosine-type recombinase/integrase n=1 Tax=Gordonia sp. KTR9 TaxID=337191 RepID=UPI00027DE876|nr:site-specific integrase [Gordonia sp. KTR9]AFR48833.1 Integrase [Gordonia sp. KTR9]